MLSNHNLDTEMRGTPLSSDDERHIGFLISDVARLLRTAFDRRVRRLGLTRSQWLVINRLHRRPGATQSELAEMLEVEKATAGRMVDRMEKKGWVGRRPDPSDRRVNRLFLTAEADLIQVQLAQIADRTVDDALALLSAFEREQFSEWMRRVKRQLQAMLEPERAAPNYADSGAPAEELAR
jgi:MarR family transcriptional regulator, transcriptional regulator for hemolysin